MLNLQKKSYALLLEDEEIQTPQANQNINLAVKAIFTIVLILISIQYFTADRPFTMIDGADLLLHEAGHLIWKFGGEFIGILGGSLTQVLIPIAIGLYFAARKSWYSLFFCIYWLGINLINVGIYISDAESMGLPLIIEGATHDWNFLLSKAGLLAFDQALGSGVRGLGALSILAAEITMGIHLATLYRKKRRTGVQ